MCHLKIDPKTSVHKPLVNYLWEPYKIQTLHSCLVTLFLLIFNRYVMSDSPRPHEPHTKFLCPASSSRVCSNLCPLRQWYHWPSNPLSFPLLLPSNFPSIGVFSKKSVLSIRWTTYWDFSFSISPSNEYSGLIAFTMDGFDLLAGPETLKRLLHQHSLKASVLLCSAFFMVKLSNPYITTEETTLLLTEWTFVGKVVSLHFNKLSWTVISFLPNIN